MAQVCVEDSIVVPCERMTLFQFLHSADSARLLNDDVVVSETLPGPTGLGEHQHCVRRHGDHTDEWTVEVVEYDEGNAVTIRTVDLPHEFTCRMTFEDVEGGIRVAHTHTWVLSWTVGPWRRRRFRAQAEEDLRAELERARRHVSARGRGV